MKIIYTFLIVLFFFFSCQKKEKIALSVEKKTPIKKDTLELLFGSNLFDGRFHNLFSRISYSDSVFFIMNPQDGDSQLYKKGKLILKKNILNYDEFDSIAKKYSLKVLNKVDILNFARPSSNYKFNENSSSTKLKSLNDKILSSSVLKSKSGVIFQYSTYDNEKPSTLKIYNLNRSYIFKIKKEKFGTITYDDKGNQTYTKSLEEIISYIKLIDITGDGKEELFIFYDMISSPDIIFNVYKINYIE